MTNNVLHHEQLPTDQAGGWSAAALLGWWCYYCSVAVGMWLVNTCGNNSSYWSHSSHQC